MVGVGCRCMEDVCLEEFNGFNVVVALGCFVG